LAFVKAVNEYQPSV